MNWIFNQIVSALEKIRRDRLYHLIVGLLIGACCSITFNLGYWSPVVVAVIAWLKEMFDKARGSEPDLVDFAFTLTGGLLITLFYLFNAILWN